MTKSHEPDGAAMPSTRISRRTLGTALAAMTVLPSASSQGTAPSPPAGPALVPEAFGAVGDGRADDTAALQRTFDRAAGRRVVLAGDYLVTRKLSIAQGNCVITGGGRIVVAPHFALTTAEAGTHMRVLFVEAAGVTFDGIGFDASRAPAGSAVENGLIWSTAATTSVRGCRFVGNPKGSCIWGLGNAPFLSVTDCRFEDCSSAAVLKGRGSVVRGNIIVNATDAAIAINGVSCTGAVITGNTIQNDRLAVIPSMIGVEEGASEWTITGNTLVGVNGGGIICINVLASPRVKGGVIADNVISARDGTGRLPRSASPAVLLSISGNYLDWIVRANRISGCPTGNSNSRLVMVAASGGLLTDNMIDGSSTPGLSALVTILEGAGGVTISDNQSTAAAGVRHYLFEAGRYERPCTFIGGKLFGGAEGVNAEFKIAGITGLALEIRQLAACTAANAINAPTLLGDRASFLNAGAVERPHQIGRTTDMSCTGEPGDPGRVPFQQGDRFWFMAPRAGGHVGVVRVGQAWRPFGPIA